MRLLFMGTGAADWDISERRDGEFFRRCTSVMINDDLLLDFNDDTVDFIEATGCDVGKVENILVTHTHGDHYSNAAVNKYFEKNTVVRFEKGAEERIGELAAEKKAISLFEETTVGKYTVVALPANHSVQNSPEQPVHYVISDGEKCIFWGCDGAWLLNRTRHEAAKYKYDLVVFDGTLNDNRGDYRIFEHNNLTMVVEMSEAFKSLGLMKPNSKTMISHMSKYSQYPHDELERYLMPYGIVPAYDGLRTEI